LERLQKVSLIIDLLMKLRDKGSWCGETHIQKSIYFLQELTRVPMEFDFILYKHGPFAFDLRDELNAMRADDLIEHVFQPAPYGPTLAPTRSGINIHDHFPKTVKQYSRELDFVANYLGDKGVAELERMGTALFVTLKNNEEDIQTRVLEITEMKPHISQADAQQAIEEVERMETEFQAILLNSIE
jgi:hypothetical protein